ncbi:MAG: sigma-54-dependent Fis family transcriptional regulator [Bacteroidales bacterium]|nr:sigma-54-dependent Fis family transcriptional regulator [Bacteroidales bacterium]
MGTKLLLADDHKPVLKALTQLLESEFDDVKAITNPNLIPGLVKEENYDIILLDMNFSAGINTGNEGIFWLNRILKIDPLAVVVMITAYGDVELAVRAMKEGATDFVIKPWDNEKLIATLQSAYKLRKSKIEIRNYQEKQSHLVNEIDKPFNQLIGNSPGFLKILNEVKKFAKTDANVLILGENGTGKELVAREIHRQSKRSKELLITVDMGAIAETIFESEMFGHVKGAYTDAKNERAGRFEIASGGTLFLDEIGNLSLSMQAKLLTALNNREIYKVGASKSIPIDIRLICATNKDLKNWVINDLFREDLYYRINTIEITIPPLRERREDIVELAGHFLKEYATKYQKPLLKFNAKTINKLIKYHWPGNIRELRHAVEKAVILTESDIIRPEDFLLSSQSKKDLTSPKPISFVELEKQAIINALDNNRGNVVKAAKELGLARQTLYNKMGKYKLY